MTGTSLIWLRCIARLVLCCAKKTPSFVANIKRCAGRFPYSGETWDQFRERVAALRLKLSDAPRQANILAFTSATPTGVLTGLALDAPDSRMRQLAGVLHNASYTVLRQRGEHLQLFQFNAVPHLSAPELRTHR